MNKRNTAFVGYMAALLLFGSNGVVAGNIGLDSYEIVLLRTLIGSLLLIGIFFIRRERPTFFCHKKDFVFLCVSGIAMGTSWMFLYEAYARIGVSVASLCYYCGPMIVMVLSPLVFGERLTVIKVGGFASVLVGIFLVNGYGAAGADRFGLICGLMSAVMYALMVIFNKKAGNIVGLENSALQLFIAFVTVALFVGMTKGLAIAVPKDSIFPMLFLGLVNTGIGCYLYFSSIGFIPVQTVAVCGYLEPLSAVLFSAVFLGERLTLLQTVGAFLIIGGAVASEYFGAKSKSRT